MPKTLNDAFDLVKGAAEKHDPQITRYKHTAALISKKDQLIAIGRNYYDGKEIETDEGILSKTIHAEINALSKVNIRRLDGAILLSYSRTKATTRLGRPCDNCYAVLKKLGLKKMFYSMPSSLETPVWKEEQFE